MEMKINYIAFFTRYFKESKKFYEEKLDLKVNRSNEGFAAFQLEGEQELYLLDVEMASQMIGEDIVQPGKEGVCKTAMGITVEDTDKAYEELRAKGVEFVKPPTSTLSGPRTAYFKDYDGHLFYISNY